MTTGEVLLRRWTRAEYDRLLEQGFFQPGERVELIDGAIVTMAPQRSGHAAGISLSQEALRVAFGPAFHVRVQLPLALGPVSEPEPDLAVVVGTPRDRAGASDDGGAGGRGGRHDARVRSGTKGAVYARAGIPEYWILNLAERVLEVRRGPAAAPDGSDRWEYREVRRYGPDEVVSPLAVPAARIRVRDLLP
ncbi:MAG: Uma2 family endonuclease [Dehalococcoidia bacterium]